MMVWTRRAFLQSTFAGATVLGLASMPALARGERLTVIDLGGGVRLITGGAANVVAYGGPDGLLLIDGGPKAQSAGLLKEALNTTGARKLHTLFNTHWHPDQTGLNEQAAKGGATIIAHENTKQWLKRRINTDWLPPSGYGPLPAAAIPNKSFYTRETLAFGDEELNYGHLGQAHTDGDVSVLFRKANVLVAGGVVSNDRWPLLDWQTGGWIGGLVGAYDRLIKDCNEQTKIVPANGAPLDLATLQQQREMYMAIYESVVKGLTKGLGPEETYATQPAKDFEARMGDSRAFVVAAFKSLWGHYAPDA